MTDTRQPLTVENILVQCMEILQVDTPTDMLRAITEMTSAPAPLLVVDAAGQITARKDLTVYGLTQIMAALNNLKIAGGSR